MAKARAIIKRLKAVRNVRKITRTMELVATARFKKAMDRATQAAAYTRKISEIVSDLSETLQETGSTVTHPLLEQRETENKSVLLVVTSNRGLCGGYNSAVLRQTQQRIRQAKSAAVQLDIEVSGKRGIGYFKFQKLPTTQSYMHFDDKVTFDQVDVLAKRYAEQFVRGEIDRLDVAYTRFQSMSRQVAVVETLLPIEPSDEPIASSSITCSMRSSRPPAARSSSRSSTTCSLAARRRT